MKLNSISYCVYFYKVFYVWNKFLTPFNSHFMQVPIIAIIEFLGIAVAYFFYAGELYTIPHITEEREDSICILAKK